jgi:hypothetical protein
MLSGARSSLKSRRALALENLALRQQLAVLRRQAKRPKISRDHLCWRSDDDERCYRAATISSEITVNHRRHAQSGSS